MKSTSAGIWLTLASIAIISFPPGQAQTTDATAAPAAPATATTATTAPDSTVAPPTSKTKKHHLHKQKAKKSKKVKYRKSHVSGTSLQGGVSKKHKWGKKEKAHGSAQQQRLDKLNATLSNPKHYKKVPELSSPGGMTTSHSSPGL